MPDRQPFALVCLVAERALESCGVGVASGLEGSDRGTRRRRLLGWLGVAQPHQRGSLGCPGPAHTLRGCHELQGQLPPSAGCPALAIVPAPASLSCTSPAAARPPSPPRGGGRCLQRCSSSLCCRVLLLELCFSRPCRFAAGVRPACFAGRGALNTSDPPPQAAFCPAPLPPHHSLSLP